MTDVGISNLEENEHRIAILLSSKYSGLVLLQTSSDEPTTLEIHRRHHTEPSSRGPEKILPLPTSMRSHAPDMAVTIDHSRLSANYSFHIDCCPETFVLSMFYFTSSQS